MIVKIATIVGGLLLLSLSGCLIPSMNQIHNEVDPHNVMEKSLVQEITLPSSGMAKVYFIRPWSLYSLAQLFPVLHVVNNKITSIGALEAGARVSVEVFPRKNSFMLVQGTNTLSVFLENEFESDKVYFVIVRTLEKDETSIFGPPYYNSALFPLFEMIPTKPSNSEKLAPLIKGTTQYQWKKDFKGWGKDVQQRLEQTFASNWPKWKKMKLEKHIMPFEEAPNNP